MSDTELSYLSATEALSRFRNRSLSPRELLEALIRRAESIEPIINSFADRYFDEALTAAIKAERRYAKGSPSPRRLEGIPVAVKDDANIKGKRATQGSLIYKDHESSFTDPHVARLKRAGAIVHARTTCPEFCAAWITDSRLHGLTRCPWNTDYTPGGSSGGSAASLAAGTTILASGSDNAGSIRQPASLCGVVGYKPPHGRIPTSPPYNIDTYSVVGPLTRTVADCALMVNVMAGPDPKDIASIKSRIRLPLEADDLSGLKIAYSIDLDYFAVHDEVRENTEQTVAALKEAGAEVEHVTLGWSEEVKRIGMTHYAHYYGDSGFFEQHRDLLCDYSIYYAEQNSSRVAENYAAVVEITAKMYETLGPILTRSDAFICPTVTVPSIPAAMRPHELFEIDGRQVDADFGWCMTYPFNMLGQLPALAVPSGISTSGVPTGVQIVTRAFDDARVFRVARALERVRPWGYDAPSQLG